VCSSISKGKVFAFESNFTSETTTSISQVSIFGFACHSGLDLTFHSTVITNSLLNLSAVSHASLSSSGSKTI
jgi:hypothetical protein